MHAIAEFACVAFGGALGASIRYVVSGPLARFAGVSSWMAIIGVNILGSVLAGVLVGVWAPGEGLAAKAFLLVGVSGGLTTFSTAMLDSWVLWATNRRGLAWFCLVGTPVLAIIGAMLGHMIGGQA